MTQLFTLLAAGAAIVPAFAALLPASIATSIITKDVAIIGGGASGAYAAIRLKEDFGKSIVLIEKEAELVSISPAPYPMKTKTDLHKSRAAMSRQPWTR